MQLSHILKKDYSSSSLTHLTHLSLYGRNYSIYSDTRWCNGVDEVWKRIAIKNITLGVCVSVLLSAMSFIHVCTILTEYYEAIVKLLYNESVLVLVELFMYMYPTVLALQ